MIIDISNKTVVITGSSRGIGKELAKKFASEKANVVINYFRSEESANKLYAEISKYNNNCILIKADITDKEDVIKLYNKTIQHFGKIDVLINNAGICQNDDLLNLSFQKWTDVINVNLNGVFNCTKIFVDNMIQNKFGKIINIASYKGIVANENQSCYCASKAAVISFTKSIAKELGKNNISVNTICPGFIKTDLNKIYKTKEIIAQKESVMSINNNLEDFLDFVCYLSSNNSRSISGQVFNIDSRII